MEDTAGIARSIGLALAVVLAYPAPLAAQSWTSSGSAAGLSVDGGYNGLSFACTGAGRAQVVFSGFGQRLQPNASYTVALSVDGVASLYQASANAGGTALLVDQPIDSLKPVIEQLRKGRAAEVSGPAGRYDVPLKGSGAALARFLDACR